MSESKENDKNESPWAGLSNEELVVVYNRFKQYHDEVIEHLNQGILHKKVRTPVGEAVRVIQVSPEQVEEFKNTEYFKNTESILSKLEPIVSMIHELPESKTKSNG